MPFIDIALNGFDIKNKSFSIILSNVNKYTQQIDFNTYFNADQLIANNKTLNIAKELLTTSNTIPFISKEIYILPYIKLYKPKSIKLNETFTRHIAEYFESCYTGKPYKPPYYTKEEIQKLVKYISKTNSHFFNDVQKAHKSVKESLQLQTEIYIKDHARKL